MFGDHFWSEHRSRGERKRFLDALAGESDPEAKRKIIGRVFVEVFDEEALKLDDVKMAGAGTIYPGRYRNLPPATGKSARHQISPQRGRPAERDEDGLVEPLRELFKDEVRKIGLELGLPYDMLYRHPFPGQPWRARAGRSEERVLRPAASRGRYLHRRADKADLYKYKR